MENIKQRGTPLTLQEISEAAKKRVARISKEFTDGFEFIQNYPRSVTFFGSSRTEEGELYYEKARALARRIVEELHYSVITGGGPGIMSAANRGAYEGGGNSIGLTIELPLEQTSNKYITDSIGFHYFFSRKVCLAFSAEAYVFFPGGFGTLDEFTEILTLVQTGKINKVPIILVGEDHWIALQNFFKSPLIEEGMINAEDISLYTITDNENQILKIIKEAPIRIGMEYNGKPIDSKKNAENSFVSRSLSELSKKHCIPCEGGVPPLSHQESNEYLKEINSSIALATNEWQLVENKEIWKTYEFKDFREAIDFMNSVASIAEEQGHHPDIKLHDYKKVDIKISTHAIDGLSENDFILAAKIDEIIRPHP